MSGDVTGTPAPDPVVRRIDTGTVELRADPRSPRAFLLLVNGVESSYVDLDRPELLDFEYQRWAAVVLASALGPAGPPASGVDPVRVLHLGAAGCALPRALLAGWPGSRHVAVDLDGVLLQLVRDWFALPGPPALQLVTGDAAEVTAAQPVGAYRAVVRDVFSGDRTPEPLRTTSFAREVDRILEPAGMYLLNCGDGPDLIAARAEMTALAGVFEYLLMVADPPMLKGRRRGNIVMVGAHRPIDADALARELRAGAVPAQAWDDRRCRAFARHRRS
ncbi:fused MFS/spermidine synthase [Nakamurella flavida]|uniref:Fused MFS/spermidine synthase n=1 Tax=Nakamurella flavida TaxID=363630 RepID=A0A939C2T3_9ACTN|nr:fused MFS/spermidine synthase [Nakamurella flavida]MBM9476356.1 fused MFS/spermidine synthase [Nakamurella flavida]MDP9779544.1 spermidine synthase [Nakamurella flavida]